MAATSRAGATRVLGATAVTGAALLLGFLVAEPPGLRISLAAAAGFLFVVVALHLPTGAVLGFLVVWLVALGSVRRLTTGLSPKAALGDPLLLVGAATWTVLAVLALRRGALTRGSPLSKAVIGLGGVLAASAVNPLQGGLAVGLGGALLVVVPMSAFIVGRSFADDRMFARMLRLAAWLGVAAAAYGLVQAFIGFPLWDATWVRDEGYTALNVNGQIRAFSSFSAASEYVGFLGIAVVVWVANARGLVRRSVAAGAIALVGTAMWYQASRGIVVVTIAAIGLMSAACVGIPLGRALLGVAALVAAIPVVIGQLAPQQFSNEPGAQLAQHQVAGLSDPFGKGSTLPLHVDLMLAGITGAFRDPVGLGVGATSIAAGKYGGMTRGSEVDPGNAAIAAGLPGLVTYLAVVALGIALVYRLAVRRRDALSIAALGIVAVTSLQWLNGGQYAVAFWPWLVLGWADATAVRERQASEDLIAEVPA